MLCVWKTCDCIALTGEPTVLVTLLQSRFLILCSATVMCSLLGRLVIVVAIVDLTLRCSNLCLGAVELCTCSVDLKRLVLLSVMLLAGGCSLSDIRRPPVVPTVTWRIYAQNVSLL